MHGSTNSLNGNTAATAIAPALEKVALLRRERNSRCIKHRLFQDAWIQRRQICGNTPVFNRLEHPQPVRLPRPVIGRRGDSEQPHEALQIFVTERGFAKFVSDRLLEDCWVFREQRSPNGYHEFGFVGQIRL